MVFESGALTLPHHPKKYFAGRAFVQS
jgi:hypothetical protein